MKFLKRAIIILMLFAVMSPAVFFAADAAESYTVSYGKGYFFLNTLTGAEATGIFTGKIPPSVTVEAGGSVTVAENTIVQVRLLEIRIQGDGRRAGKNRNGHLSARRRD